MLRRQLYPLRMLRPRAERAASTAAAVAFAKGKVGGAASNAGVQLTIVPGGGKSGGNRVELQIAKKPKL